MYIQGSASRILLTVDLIERSCIIKALIENLIDDQLSSLLIGAIWITCHA